MYLPNVKVCQTFKALKETRLKIFKHHKLKPSFSIINKDKKAKDRIGAGDKPPPPSINRSINPNMIQLKSIIPNVNQFDQVSSNLNQLDLISSNWNQFEPT